MLPILLALAIVAILLVVVIAGVPDDFVVCRSTKSSASAQKIFANVNDLHKWNDWSPWAKLDPNAKSTFEGAPAGIGAVITWDGNKKIGAGRMTITDSRPNDYIRFKLEFFRPFAATNTAEFTFRPDGTGTEVQWKMSGQTKGCFKVFHMFVNCDDMCGKDFQKGLESLKAVSEK